MNTDIFQVLDPDNNYLLSKLNKKELDETLNLLNEYNLSLRDTLNINKSETFGFEFEFEYANINEIKDSMKNYFDDGWILKKDDTIPTGRELATKVFCDKKETWNSLRDACMILRRYSAIGENCGGHIHIGSQIIEQDENFANFIKTWIAFENIIYRFSYGEYLYNRPDILEYAQPITKNILLNQIELEFDMLFGCVRYGPEDAICLRGFLFDKYRLDNTIEFRCPNGSLNPVIWQNNLNLFIKIIKYSKTNYNDKLIKSIIEKNIKNYNQYKLSNQELLNIYSTINLNDAILMCDIIFDNNLDKIYFLRQYLKSFETEKIYRKAKTFTIL